MVSLSEYEVNIMWDEQEYLVTAELEDHGEYKDVEVGDGSLEWDIVCDPTFTNIKFWDDDGEELVVSGSEVLSVVENVLVNIYWDRIF